MNLPLFHLNPGCRYSLRAALFGLLLCCLAWLPWAAPAFATTHAPVIELTDYVGHPPLQYLLDSTIPDVDLRSATLADIHANTSLNWALQAEGVPNFGFSTDTAVLRMRLHNPAASPQQYLLYLDYPLIDHIEVALFYEGQQLGFPVTGDLHPLATRPVHARNFVFPLTLDGNATADLYLRARATDTLQIPLHLFSADAFAKTTEMEFYIWGLYYGAMLAMLMFTLCLLVILRDRSLVYFVLFVLSYIIVSLSLNGFLDYLFLREAPTHSKWIRALFLNLGLASCVVFSIDYLKLKTYSPWAHRGLKFVLVLALIAALLSLIIPFYFAIQLTLLIIMFSAIFLFTGGVSSWLKGYPPAKYYVVAWLCFFMGGFANLLRAFAWLPTNIITEYGVQLGSAVNVMLLALGIAYRFDVERKQLFQAETRALNNEKLAQEERERRLKAQLKAQEEQLKSEKAHAETQAKSQFLANMSHEIRTPMNGVLGMTQLLKDTALSTQQSQYIATIENSGNALLRIINDILDFSKIEAGKLDIEHIPFDLPDLIDDSTDIFALVAAEKNLNFRVTMAPDLPLRLQSDPTRIKQILLNLLSNAFKFTEQGSIHLRVERDSVDGLLRFMVVDTGIGVSTEQQERLFRSFSQADSSTTRKYGGTGLGLVICQRLAELLGGTIGVNSTVGFGTEFWFNIALAASPDVEPHRFTRLANQTIGLISRRPQLFDDIAPTLRHYGATALFLQCEPRTLSEWAEQVPGSLSVLVIDRNSLSDEDCTTLQSAPWSQYRLVYLVSDLREKDSQLPANARCIGLPLTTNKLAKQLSADTPHQTIPTATRNHTPRFPGLRVLVTEDNKVNQMVIKGMLAKMGIQPLLAENGRLAVESMVQHPDIHCIIMDCEMPEMDGYQATRHIRTLPGQSSTRPLIVGLSANAMREQEQQALDAGMNHYLRKPVKFDEIVMTLLNAFPDYLEREAASWQQEASRPGPISRS